ncbi:MAG: serine/threonine-protein phosphatase [Spirochaetaceae bacterium]|jgi:sigma-B regulation protein RsbU (phosphoserine phosphatase)|nr:serine/threonine-protein phosphatase [Spirochaetaceae bacterium]
MTKNAEALGRLFSPLQIGYIAKCIEPLNASSDVGWALEMISDQPDMEVVPIERDGAVLGVVSRRVLEKLAGSAWTRFWQKDLDAYLIPAKDTIEASAYIGKIAEDSLKNTQGDTTAWFIVQHKRAYLGVVSLQQMLEYMNTLRAQDLNTAGEIQRYLLKKSVVNDKRINLFFYNQMAHEIGGDFYQIFKSGNDRYLVACFDVAGKNISGALAAMALGTFFTALRLFKYEGTAEIMTGLINTLVKEVNPPGIFVSAVLFYIDFSTMTVKIHNCGFSPVRVFIPQREEKKIILKVMNAGLPPLGIQEELEFDGGGLIPLTRGLRLTAYSDGLTDMGDIFGERFGEKRTDDFLKSLHTVPHGGLKKVIDTEIDRWIGEASLADDITLVDIRFP